MNEPAKLSWNTHALLTLGAFRSEVSPLLAREVPVVPLKDFLETVGSPLQTIVAWYQDLLRRKARSEHVTDGPFEEIRSADQFFRALRIRPGTPVHYVKILPLEEVSPEAVHDRSRCGPPGGSYVETGCNGSVRAQEVVCTFSDEPDWGMDQDLFPIEDYGYGSPPFGGISGISSQAPFHMAFFWENPLLVGLLPRLKLSFMEERIRVFFGLARLAFEHGVDYWGWRFTAWAIHYLQDLTQPYHARAFPFPLSRVLFAFLGSGSLEAFVHRYQNVLRNRHTLFEAVVHLVLNEAFKKRETHPFLLALANAGEAFSGKLLSVMKASARVPARLNRKVDRSLVALMGDSRFDDPAYCLATDDTYRIDETLPEASRRQPEALERFIESVRACLVETGNATRCAIRRIERSVRV